MAEHVLPVPDDVSAPYWQACARHELTLARCADCGLFAHPPDITCPNCHSLEPLFAFTPVAGGGRVMSWITVRHSFLSGFELPFLLVDVQLDQHPQIRLIGRLVDGPETPLAIGDAVSVVFDDLAPGVAVPAFALASAT
jgi:uncharacterized protein